MPMIKLRHFLQLLRSAGLKGLGRIKARDGYKIRPLLEVFKSDIYRYAAQHGVPFRRINQCGK